MFIDLHFKHAQSNWILTYELFDNPSYMYIEACNVTNGSKRYSIYRMFLNKTNFLLTIGYFCKLYFTSFSFGIVYSFLCVIVAVILFIYWVKTVDSFLFYSHHNKGKTISLWCRVCGWWEQPPCWQNDSVQLTSRWYDRKANHAYMKNIENSDSNTIYI